MTKASLVVLGWMAEVDETELKRFHARFKYDYDVEFLRNCVIKGDYLSDIPFGIGALKGFPILVCEHDSQFLSISMYPVAELSPLSEDLDTDGLDTFAITSIYLRLSGEGYERPVDVRSFLGKTKGLARLTGAPILCLASTFVDSELEFHVNRAERFSSIALDDGQSLILYSPRHEISEPKLGLSAKNLIPQDLIENQALRRSPESVLQRYQQVSSILGRSPYRNVRLNPIEPYPSWRYHRPSLSFPDGSLISLEDFPDESLETVMLSHISFNERFDVAIVADNTGNLNEMEAYAREFSTAFSDNTGIEPSLSFLNDAEQLGSHPADTVIIILDDLTPGSGFVYDSVKSILNVPSKAVKLSTLKKGDMRKTALLEYLSLRARNKQKLYQDVEDELPETMVGLSLHALRRGDFLVLSGAAIHNSNIVQRVVLLENDREAGTPTEQQTISFLQSLLHRTDFPTNLLVMTPDMSTLARRLQGIAETEQFALVHVSEIDAVVLESDSGNHSLPRDGSFIRATENQALIVTNGSPERNLEEGIPSPIQAEVMVSVDHNAENLFRWLYYQTFLHPASLLKPKLPLPVHACRTIGVPLERLFITWEEEGVYL